MGPARMVLKAAPHILPPLKSFRGRLAYFPKYGADFRCTTPYGETCPGCYTADLDSSPQEPLSTLPTASPRMPGVLPVVCRMDEFVVLNVGVQSCASTTAAEDGTAPLLFLFLRTHSFARLQGESSAVATYLTAAWRFWPWARLRGLGSSRLLLASPSTGTAIGVLVGV